MKPRKRYFIAAGLVIFFGVASRLITTGSQLFDNSLGDALYASLLYLLLRIARPHHARIRHALWAFLAVVVIELFQLTGIPQALRDSGKLLLILLSTVLGTTFGFRDLVAYAVGVLGVYLWDRRLAVRAGDDIASSSQLPL